MGAYGQVIGRAIFDVLSTDSTILAYLDAGQIQPVLIYDQAPQIGIFYEVSSVTNTNVKGPDLTPLSIVDFQVEVFHTEFKKMKLISTQIEIALDKLSAGTYGLSGGVNLDGCIMTDLAESFDKSTTFYYCTLGFSARVVNF